MADCPPVDGGSDRIRSDPPRTLADFLCPHKVRLSPPESAEKRSSADTGADSGGQWRTQADPIGSAADSGGQLSASIKPELFTRSDRKETYMITPSPSQQFIYKSSWLWNEFRKIIGQLDFSSPVSAIKNLLTKSLLNTQGRYGDDWCDLNFAGFCL